MGMAKDEAAWQDLADHLFTSYDRQFQADLGKGYGSYSVLWPCRLYSLAQGAAAEQFRTIGVQQPSGWRYFPLARDHQGLLAGNREAGYATLALHLDHEQMRGWYAFDEGGESGTGGWNPVRTTWKQGKDSVAMPHGWAIAEAHLLLRDCLLFEDEDRLVLFAGVPPQWFTHSDGMSWTGMPTYFGPSSVRWIPTPNGAELTLNDLARPPGGFVLRLPNGWKVTDPDTPIRQISPQTCDFLVPPTARSIKLSFHQ
jgi:hypothetical protein